MNHKDWIVFLKERAKVSPLCMPNLFGVGAARCGTTTLYHVFKQSKSVYVPDVKELSYFSNNHRDEKNGTWFEEDYLAFFVGGEDKLYRADITPHYLHSRRALERIYAAAQGAKIIIQLRNPVDRAISHYRHHYNAHGFEDINEYFSLGIQEYNKNNVGWVSWKHPLNNMRQSFYCDAVSSYFDRFGRESCFVITMDELSNNQEEVLSQLSSWLGTELGVLEGVRKNLSKPLGGEVSEEIRRELYRIYEEDWEKTKSLVNGPCVST